MDHGHRATARTGPPLPSFPTPTHLSPSLHLSLHPSLSTHPFPRAGGDARTGGVATTADEARAAHPAARAGGHAVVPMHGVMPCTMAHPPLDACRPRRASRRQTVPMSIPACGRWRSSTTRSTRASPSSALRTGDDRRRLKATHIARTAASCGLGLLPLRSDR